VHHRFPIVLASVASMLCLACGSDSEPRPDAGGGTAPERPRTEPLASSGNKLVTYDLRTGAQAILDLSFAAPDDGEPRFAAALASEEGGSPVPFNFQPLAPVGDPTDPFFSPHGMVLTRVDTGGGFAVGVCAGTLIGSRHVLTSAHCIFTDVGRDPGDRAWGHAVSFVPASSNQQAPFGSANGLVVHSFTGWVEQTQASHDIAIVTLDRPVGLLTGWRVVGTHPKCSFWESSGWTMVGYPAEAGSDSMNGSNLFRRNGSFDDCSGLPATVTFDAPSLQGMSGAGLVKSITVDSGTYRVVWGTHFGSVPGTGPSVDTRLDRFKYDATVFALNSTTPLASDLVVLNATAQPAKLRQGETADVTVLVGNIGKQPFSGSVQMQLLRADDDGPDAGAVVLATQTAPLSLGRNAKADVTFEDVAVFGAGDAPGAYFLGVRLVVDDANDTNDRTEGFDMARVRLLHRVEFPLEDLLNGLELRR